MILDAFQYVLSKLYTLIIPQLKIINKRTEFAVALHKAMTSPPNKHRLSTNSMMDLIHHEPPPTLKWHPQTPPSMH